MFKLLILSLGLAATGFAMAGAATDECPAFNSKVYGGTLKQGWKLEYGENLLPIKANQISSIDLLVFHARKGTLQPIDECDYTVTTQNGDVLHLDYMSNVYKNMGTGDWKPGYDSQVYECKTTTAKSPTGIDKNLSQCEFSN